MKNHEPSTHLKKIKNVTKNDEIKSINLLLHQISYLIT